MKQSFQQRYFGFNTWQVFSSQLPALWHSLDMTSYLISNRCIFSIIGIFCCFPWWKSAVASPFEPSDLLTTGPPAVVNSRPPAPKHNIPTHFYEIAHNAREQLGEPSVTDQKYKQLTEFKVRGKQHSSNSSIDHHKFKFMHTPARGHNVIETSTTYTKYRSRAYSFTKVSSVGMI